MKIKSVNVFVLLVFLATISAMLSSANNNAGLKMVSLGIDVVIIGYAIINTGIEYFLSHITNPVILSCIIILCINFFISPYEPRYPLLIKYFGYVALFIAGKYLANSGYILKCNNKLIYMLAFTPLLIVALFDKTDMKTTYFANSNVFVYMGLCCALFYLFIEGSKKKQLYTTIFILLSYVLVGTSLGVIVAVVASFFVLNIRKLNIPLIIGTVTIIFIFVAFSEISVAVRIRDTIAVYQTLDKYDLTHLSEVNLYEIQQRAGSTGAREDNTSSLWRIVQWSGLLTEYIKQPLNIPFGLGADYSIATTGLPPHNDHLIILIEYGIIVYGLLFRGMIRIYRKLRDLDIFYLILAIIFYHFTDNLIDTFPPNCLFYLVIGYSYYSMKNKVQSIKS